MNDKNHNAPAAPHTVVLRDVRVALDSETGQLFIADCARNIEGLLCDLEIRSRYGLSNEDVYDRLYAMMVKEEESIIATESTRLGKRRRKEGKKKLKEQIQRIEESIRMWDESILHGYHCRILCDKYERGYTEKYRKFVRNMPNRYSLLRDMLVDTFYPEFLRKEHKRNPELVKYVNGFGQLSHLDGSSSSVK